MPKFEVFKNTNFFRIPQKVIDDYDQREFSKTDIY